VDDHLRVKEPQLENIFTIGDCAAMENDPRPQTAQVAEQEGKYVAWVLNNLAKGKQVDSFHYKYRGFVLKTTTPKERENISRFLQCIFFSFF
jgi:NADH:ubiquinone reductase (non-electrogenic)